MAAASATAMEKDHNPRSNFPRRGRGSQNSHGLLRHNNERRPKHPQERIVVSRRPPTAAVNGTGTNDNDHARTNAIISHPQSDPTECSICHEDEVIRCIAPCNHDICYRCSIRLRYLFNQFDCPICRTDAPKVLYINTDVGPFRSYNTSRFCYEKKVKGLFQNPQVEEAFNQLLSHECPFCNEQETEETPKQELSKPDNKESKAGESFKIFKSLQEHVRKTHQMYYCEICVTNLKLFTSERKCYNRTNLALHKRKGDIDDKSFKGHPLCEHCDKRYLDTDELFRHLRKDHFYCHFCDSDGKHIYFLNYNDVADHFRNDHFLCEEGECARTEFTNAFANEVDLRAHQAENHTYGNRQDQRAARTLGLAFSFGENERRPSGRGDRYPHHQPVADARPAEIPPSFSFEPEPEPMVADVHSTQDFPSLGKVKPQAKKPTKPYPTTTTASINAPREMMMYDDDEQFPNLRRGTGPTPAKERSRPSQPAPSKSVPSKPPTTTSASKVQNKREPVRFVDEEFPSLGGQYSPPIHSSRPTLVPSKPPQNSAPSNQRVPPRSHKSAVEREFPALPSSAEPKDPLWQAPTKMVKSEPKVANNELGYKATTEDDYPALGGKTGAMNPAQWYNYQTQKPSKKGMRKAPAPCPDLSEPDPEIERQLNKHHRKEQSAIPAEGKKKKDKKTAEEKKVETKKDWATTAKEVAHQTLKTPIKQEPKPEPKPITSNSAESFLSNTKLPTFSTTNEEKPPTANTSSKIEFVDPASIEPATPIQPAGQFKLKKSEYPTLSSSKSASAVGASWPPTARPTTAPPGLTKKTSPPGLGKSGYSQTVQPPPPPGLMADDFPSLSGSKTKTAPPPGLQAKANSGWISGSSAAGGVKSKTQLAKSANYSYSKPGDFGERSRLLIRLIREEIGEATFGKFQQLLQEYRTGELAAQSFVSQCELTIGRDVFIRFLPELIALLPNIEKQQGLFLASEDRLQKSYAKFQSLYDDETADNLVLFPCECCGQILRLGDLYKHQTDHD